MLRRIEHHFDNSCNGTNSIISGIRGISNITRIDMRHPRNIRSQTPGDGRPNRLRLQYPSLHFTSGKNVQSKRA